MSHSARFQATTQELSQQEGLPFSQHLSPDQVQQILEELQVKYRVRNYPPQVLLWMFLSQLLSTDGSCREAVIRHQAYRLARGKPRCSTNTGSYCQARSKLPTELISRLSRQTANSLHQQSEESWRLHGRRIKMVDGSTLPLETSEENLKEYPAQSNQCRSNHIPMMRFVVIFCLATAGALEMASGPCEGKGSSEKGLFRDLMDTLEKEDLVLGDRFYGDYRTIAELKSRGVDSVFRLKASRRTDFRRGKRLGKYDHVVTWKRPAFNKKQFTREEYDQLPETLQVREVRVWVDQRGFRTKCLTVVTTLLEGEELNREEIAELYRHRWEVELDLKSLKSGLRINYLRCKTPAMVKKELWGYLLAYNLIRSLIAEAARAGSCSPRELSFQAAVQAINGFAPLFGAGPLLVDEEILKEIWSICGEHRVRNRPGRYEPRKRRRREKQYPLMKDTRQKERNQCLATS